MRAFVSYLVAITAAAGAACEAADALSGWPAQLNIQSPADQSILTGFPVNDPPAVELLDADGRPIAGAVVTFRSSGVVGAVTTGNDGIAALPAWNPFANPQGSFLRAEIPAPFRVPPVAFGATGEGAAFAIDVRFLTSVAPARQAVFTAAAARWTQAVYGDIADLFVGTPAGICFGNEPALIEEVDDVIIFVTVDSIDGPGAILGGAAPCIIRTAGRLPLVGVMVFDSADVATLEQEGLFEAVIVHEMAHVLGFGTLWGVPPDLNLLVGAGGSDPVFTGAHGRRVFDRVGGAAYVGSKVPVENTGGSGTRDSHWRESVFEAELMTGYVNPGVPNPLSAVTIASLRDEGYRVNYAAGDAFVLPSASAVTRSAPARPAVDLRNDILPIPLYEADGRGGLRLVRRP